MTISDLITHDIKYNSRQYALLSKPYTIFIYQNLESPYVYQIEIILKGRFKSVRNFHKDGTKSKIGIQRLWI